MICTYQIQYDDVDGIGDIEFCASTKEEALVLFRDWCTIDNNMSEPINPFLIESVYNEADAIEYGNCYCQG